MAALTALLWGGVVRMFVLHHVTYSINSLAHRWGSQRYATEDAARLVNGILGHVQREVTAARAGARVILAEEDFRLVIAPEGTRKGAAKWKSGFYHIAIGAGVPIVPGWVDYEAGCAGLGPAIMPTGDYVADMARIAAFFAEVMPGHPRLKAIMQGLENND